MARFRIRQAATARPNPGDEDLLLHWRSRPEAHLYQLRRAPELNDAYVDAAVYAVEQRFLETGGKPRAFSPDPFHALEFCSHTSKLAGYSRNGGWRDDEALGFKRSRRYDRYGDPDAWQTRGRTGSMESKLATDDCNVVGHGHCPCGKGTLTVELCMPDHAYARVSQAWYRNSLDCEECSPKYGFFESLYGEKAMLVLHDDLMEIGLASDAWHRKIKEIENSHRFKDLASALDKRLAREKSITARYRLLSGAGMMSITSLHQYRKYGYVLRVGQIRMVLALLGLDDPGLVAQEREAEALWARSKRIPNAITTGVNGLAI
jgi:hypothetical protein